MDACAAFLTPKMDLSQVMPSGCHLRRVAQPPANQLAVPDRPSASDFQEDEETINPEDMRMAVTTPAFQPYRGGGRRSPAVACWASDHWVASSNPLRGKFRH